MGIHVCTYGMELKIETRHAPPLLRTLQIIMTLTILAGQIGFFPKNIRRTWPNDPSKNSHCRCNPANARVLIDARWDALALSPMTEGWGRDASRSEHYDSAMESLDFSDYEVCGQPCKHVQSLVKLFSDRVESRCQSSSRWRDSLLLP